MDNDHEKQLLLHANVEQSILGCKYCKYVSRRQSIINAHRDFLKIKLDKCQAQAQDGRMKKKRVSKKSELEKAVSVIEKLVRGIRRMEDISVKWLSVADVEKHMRGMIKLGSSFLNKKGE